MGLESATYISDLVATWPLGTDKIRQGDDHLREIKKAIKNTFPNINGEVTATQAILNNVPANLSAIITQLVAQVLPMGVIVAWSGSIASIPTGWALCNGQNVSGYGVVPDLRNRFLVGAGDTYSVAATGGNTSVTTSAGGGHNHGGNTGDTTLTVGQLPAHGHDLYTVNTNASGGDTQGFGASGVGVAGDANANRGYRTNTVEGSAIVQQTGSGSAHNHTITAQADHTHTAATLPPYYALAYIIKVTQYVAP